MTATGAANLNGGLKVTGGTETDELKVTGVATVDSLKVTNNAEIGGNANVKGELYAANNKFSVDENANIFTAGGLTVKEGAMIGGGLSVTDGLAVTGGANITGNSLVTGNLGVTGLTTLTGGLTVSGQTTLNNNLHVNGNADIDGNLKVGSVADVEQSIVDLEAYTEDLKDADLPGKVEGIDRDPVDGSVPNGEGVTTIEGMAEFDKFGMTIGDTVVTDGKITTNTINAGGTIIDSVGMTVGSTVVNDGKITVGAEGDRTVIDGGAITAKSLVLGTKDVGATIAGIDRETVTDEFGTVNTTTIEGALKVSDNGLISNADGSFTVDSNGGLFAGAGAFAADMTGITMKAPVQMFLQGDYNYKGNSVIDLGITISDIDDRLDDLEYKTQNINGSEGTTAGGEGGTAAGEGNKIDVPATDEGHTGINGNVTVGGEINAGAGNIGGIDMEKGTITTGDTTIDGDGIKTGNGNFSGEVTVGNGTDKTTINGGTITTGGTTINGSGINTGNITAGTGNIGGIGMAGGTIETGDTNIDGSGIKTGNGTFTGDVNVGNKVTVGDGTDKTTINGGNITTGDITAGTGTIGKVDMDNAGIIVDDGTAITKDAVTTGDITADTGNIGGINMKEGTIKTGNTTINGSGMTITGKDGNTTNNISDKGMIVTGSNGTTNISGGDISVDNSVTVAGGSENKTTINNEGITVGDKGTSIKHDEISVGDGGYIGGGDVVSGEGVSLNQTAERVGHLENRVGELEDRIDKVGAMSAAIANLRTMGYDPAAPTEVAVGIGQYRDETGAALGLFHYPNKDFMLSLSVSTSGDEVMGGIGATWKFGRKSPEKVLAAEKEKAAKAKLAKAEEMKQAAKEAKIKAQQERHAKLAAQAEAAK